MPKTQQIIHNKKAIFHMDFSNLKTTREINDLISESVRYIRSQPPVSVFTLTNIQGMHFSTEIKELFNAFIAGNKPYVKAGAVVGLSGMQQILYNSLMKMTGRDIKAFGNIEDAKNWLAGVH
jgi:hypothetical protein